MDALMKRILAGGGATGWRSRGVPQPVGTSRRRGARLRVLKGEGRQTKIAKKERAMRKMCITILAVLMLVGAGAGLAADSADPGGLKEVDLALVKGVEGASTGKLMINTASGTDVAIRISGLDPKGIYTAFFVNTKSLMFEGIGPAPHVLAVSETGEVDVKTTVKKNIYKRYVEVGIYLNPPGRVIGNPVWVKAALGDLVAPEKPKPILTGKLR
jgi:hypothetical protein